jgi:ABC-2 type transport system permease protein
MKKYWILFLQILSQYSAYRGQIIYGIIQSFITPGIMLMAISSAQPTAGIKAWNLLSYYLPIALVYSVTHSEIDDQIDTLAASGEVNNFFLKPLSFYRYLLFKEFGERVITFLTLSPLIIAACVWQKYTPLNLSAALICLLISFWLSFNFSYFIGLFSFWIDMFWAVSNVRFVIVQLFGGVVLPFVFFPSRLVQLINLSPFPYMVSWPVKLLNGQFLLTDLLTAAFWSVLLFLIARRFSVFAFTKYSFTAA